MKPEKQRHLSKVQRAEVQKTDTNEDVLQLVSIRQPDRRSQDWALAQQHSNMIAGFYDQVLRYMTRGTIHSQFPAHTFQEEVYSFNSAVSSLIWMADQTSESHHVTPLRGTFGETTTLAHVLRNLELLQLTVTLIQLHAYTEKRIQIDNERIYVRSIDKSKNIQSSFNVTAGQTEITRSLNLLSTKKKKRWADFAPLSCYLTVEKCFMVHVEGQARERTFKEELESFVEAFVNEHFSGCNFRVVGESFKALVGSIPFIRDSTPEPRINGLIIEKQMSDPNQRNGESQTVGIYLKFDSIIYWVSTAHGLQNVLALDTPRGPPETLQAGDAPNASLASCTRCVPRALSFSIGGQPTLKSVCKRYKYYPEFRDLEMPLEPSVDILLGPAPVLASDVTGAPGRQRIDRMNVAGYLTSSSTGRVDYHLTGICGYSAIDNVLSSPQMFVYSTLNPEDSMVEGEIVTTVGRDQIFIDGHPSAVYGSGLLAIKPSNRDPRDHGHSHATPDLGHSGSVWCVLDNNSHTPSCRAFAITVAIASNFGGIEQCVWLVSDLHVSLNNVRDHCPDDFGSNGSFQCITH